ncbi:MAG TPA: DUF2442 domain-containing protein [Phycisphaerae bacterium]|nr:DUF2442 domain-containing protein [Phycisphaerae bacterium]
MSKDVISVGCPDGHQLSLVFEGGERREIDMADLLAFEGIFAPPADPAFFRRVEVNPDVGTIIWLNGADVCPDVLYERSHPFQGPAGVEPARPSSR